MDIVQANGQQTGHKEEFLKHGFIGPVPLLTRTQASFLARHVLALPKKQAGWHKLLATVDPLLYATAANPDLLRLLRDLIGDDVVLWGCSVAVRGPGKAHPWHCDVEACTPEGGFVSVSVGLVNSRKESSLCLIPGSHTYGLSIQEVAGREGILRENRTDDVVLRLARLQTNEPEIVQPEVGDGEAIFFDGRIWHGSRNTLSETTRVSLLLQYAQADRPVRIPTTFEWPFQFKEDDRPPAVVVSGRGNEAANHLVAAPSMRAASAISSRVHHIDSSLRCAEGVAFMPMPCFTGRTDNIDRLQCHYSVLMPGFLPHLPHRHVDEEILVVMSGAAELVVAKSPRDPAPKIVPAPAGTAIYYPPFQHHTIRNRSREPVRYAMLKWRSDAISASNHLSARFVPPTWLRTDSSRPIAMKTLFEGPSAFLSKLHAHVTRIAPGAGYDAHRDTHDVAIFLIKGEILVLDQRIVAPAVVFFPAGHLHDMKAAGREPAKYLVWEFHRTEAGDQLGQISVPVQPTDAILVH